MDLRVIVADNPSPLTGAGTNSFVIGGKDLAVIDPGPDLAAHQDALRAAVGDARVRAVLLTHHHADHAEGAAAFARSVGAPVLDFTTLADGAEVAGQGWRLCALHTPGHTADHLSFHWVEEDVLFCGDVVMGWSSTLIAPPEGDLVDYMRTLDRIAALAPRRLYPAHGDPVEDAVARCRELAHHRRARTAAILAVLEDGPASAESLAARIYDVPPALLPAAVLNVAAHLNALCLIGVVEKSGETEGCEKYRKAA